MGLIDDIVRCGVYLPSISEQSRREMLASIGDDYKSPVETNRSSPSRAPVKKFVSSSFAKNKANSIKKEEKPEPAYQPAKVETPSVKKEEKPASSAKEEAKKLIVSIIDGINSDEFKAEVEKLFAQISSDITPKAEMTSKEEEKPASDTREEVRKIATSIIDGIRNTESKAEEKPEPKKDTTVAAEPADQPAKKEEKPEPADQPAKVETQKNEDTTVAVAVAADQPAKKEEKPVEKNLVETTEGTSQPAKQEAAKEQFNVPNITADEDPTKYPSDKPKEEKPKPEKAKDDPTLIVDPSVAVPAAAVVDNGDLRKKVRPDFSGLTVETAKVDKVDLLNGDPVSTIVDKDDNTPMQYPFIKDIMSIAKEAGYSMQWSIHYSVEGKADFITGCIQPEGSPIISKEFIIDISGCISSNKLKIFIMERYSHAEDCMGFPIFVYEGSKKVINRPVLIDLFQGTADALNPKFSCYKGKEMKLNKVVDLASIKGDRTIIDRLYKAYDAGLFDPINVGRQDNRFGLVDKKGSEFVLENTFPAYYGEQERQCPVVTITFNDSGAKVTMPKEASFATL